MPTFQSQIFELAEGDVKDSSKTETNGASLKKGIDYTVVYQKDTTNAGNIKFTVVGDLKGRINASCQIFSSSYNNLWLLIACCIC